MQNYRIIDAHAHVFPDKVASKASESIGRFYDMPMAYDGRADTLLQLLKVGGIERCVIFSTATRPDQVSAINTFIAETAAAFPSFIGLGTLHPGMSPGNIRSEARRIADLGLKGIKLHPDFQEIYPDAEDMQPIYEQAMMNSLCFVIHAGDRRRLYSHPERIASVARRFPSLPIVAAHMGGWSQWQVACDLLVPCANVLVDTSSTLSFLPAEDMTRLIRAFGADRVLFGSDYPMWDPLDELGRFLALPLSDAERRAILSENALRFFIAGA